MHQVCCHLGVQPASDFALWQHPSAATHVSSALKVLTRRKAGKIVAAERSKWQAVVVVHVDNGVIRPAVTDVERFRDRIAPDFHPLFGKDLDSGMDKLVVLACDGETARFGNIERTPAGTGSASPQTLSFWSRCSAI